MNKYSYHPCNYKQNLFGDAFPYSPINENYIGYEPVVQVNQKDEFPNNDSEATLTDISNNRVLIIDSKKQTLLTKKSVETRNEPKGINQCFKKANNDPASLNFELNVFLC